MIGENRFGYLMLATPATVSRFYDAFLNDFPVKTASGEVKLYSFFIYDCNRKSFLVLASSRASDTETFSITSFKI